MHRCPSLLYDAASLALASALRSQHVTARLCWLLRAGWPACGARWCRRLPFSGFQAAASLGELGVGLVDVGPPSRAQRIREVGVASNLLDMPPPDPHPLRARFREAALGYSFAESSAFWAGFCFAQELHQLRGAGSLAPHPTNLVTSEIEPPAFRWTCHHQTPIPCAHASGRRPSGTPLRSPLPLGQVFCFAQVIPPSAFRGWFPGPPPDQLGNE